MCHIVDVSAVILLIFKDAGVGGAKMGGQVSYRTG